MLYEQTIPPLLQITSECDIPKLDSLLKVCGDAPAFARFEREANAGGSGGPGPRWAVMQWR